MAETILEPNVLVVGGGPTGVKNIEQLVALIEVLQTKKESELTYEEKLILEEGLHIVLLVKPGETIGSGDIGRALKENVLNVKASGMSAYPEDKKHFYPPTKQGLCLPKGI